MERGNFPSKLGEARATSQKRTSQRSDSRETLFRTPSPCQPNFGLQVNPKVRAFQPIEDLLHTSQTEEPQSSEGGFSETQIQDLEQALDGFNIKDLGDWYDPDNHSLFQSEEDEDSSGPGWESDEPEIFTKSHGIFHPEENLPEKVSNTQEELFASKSLGAKRSLSSKEVYSRLRDHIENKLLKIEKAAENTQNSANLQEIEVIQTCRSVPTFLLKLLVTSEEYKHSSASGLNEAYERTFNGFRDIVKYLDLEDALSAHLNQLQYSTTLTFAGISFPLEEVCTVARVRDEGDKASLQLLMRGRENISLRNISQKVGQNPMLGLLFKVVLKAIEESPLPLKNSLRILETLASF
ncbi:unnamed protein product [Moneuplotes crassus]|uniref:Uncharacterized protein n=1 Tax=Euplotes crassus TaxID=5936 RepID=A0AAD2CX41_EUPCR|nr:unnamed protein product [Moneuplotes crassus]